MFPSPLAVFKSLTRGFADGSLLGAAAASLRRLALGYSISLFVGVPLGLLLGRVKALDETVGALTLGLQALPSICWLPLAILWFGLGEMGVLFVVIMGSLMAFALAVRGGMLDAPVQSAKNPASKLSARPPSIPSDD